MSGCTIKEAEKMPGVTATNGSKAGLGGVRVCLQTTSAFIKNQLDPASGQAS